MKDIPFRCPECGKKFKAHLQKNTVKPWTTIRCIYCTRKLKIDIREILREIEMKADVYSKTVDDSGFDYTVIEKMKTAYQPGMVINIKFR